MHAMRGCPGSLATPTVRCLLILDSTFSVSSFFPLSERLCYLPLCLSRWSVLLPLGARLHHRLRWCWGGLQQSRVSITVTVSSEGKRRCKLQRPEVHAREQKPMQHPEPFDMQSSLRPRKMSISKLKHNNGMSPVTSYSGVKSYNNDSSFTMSGTPRPLA